MDLIESKHTPGPWLVAHNKQDPKNMSFIWRNDHGGEVPDDSRNTGYHRVCRDIAVPADANLIAAAPDHALLLAAIVTGRARVEPLGVGVEVCANGLRYATNLDENGCPVVNELIRAALRPRQTAPAASST